MSRLSGPAPRPPTRAALALRCVHRRRLAGTARDPAVAVTGSTPTDPACPFCDPPAGQLFYQGDVANPRGGIRHVVPSKASYPGEAHEALRQYRVPEESRDPRTAFLTEPPHWRALVPGGDDPLLPHLRAHLSAALDVDIAVGFVLERGLAQIEEHLKDLVERGGQLRVLTGDYREVTEPDALVRLLDLSTLAGRRSVE